MTCTNKQVFDAPAIAIGWPFGLRIAFTDAIAVAGDYKASVKYSPADASPLFTLTTDGGGLTLSGDATYIDISMSAEQTAGLKPGSVCMDVGRIDVPYYLQFLLTITTFKPVSSLT